MIGHRRANVRRACAKAAGPRETRRNRAPPLIDAGRRKSSEASFRFAVPRPVTGRHATRRPRGEDLAAQKAG